FPISCYTGCAHAGDMITKDVCLAFLAFSSEVYNPLVRDGLLLFIVAVALCDVPGLFDRDPGWRSVGNVQAGEIHVGAGDALRSSALEQQAAEQHGRRGCDDVRAQVGTTEMPLLGQHGVSSAVSGWSA